MEPRGVSRRPGDIPGGLLFRDTRAIFRLPELKSKLSLHRSRPFLGWRINRDNKLHSKRHGQEIPKVVNDLSRLDDRQYDEMLARCVALIHLFGVSANNVVVECIARNTPLLINRIPLVVEYLGPDYTLYYDDISESPVLLDLNRVLDAHNYLREMDKRFLARANLPGRLSNSQGVWSDHIASWLPNAFATSEVPIDGALN